jgi:hypothetical protein
MVGAGLDFGADLSSDSGSFAYTMVTGDFDVSVQIMNHPKVSTYGGKAGIMARKSLNANSEFISLGVKDESGRNGYFAISTHRRKSPGGTHPNGGWRSLWDQESLATYTYPMYIRMVRTGNLYTTYHSQDGVNWILFEDYRAEAGDTSYDIQFDDVNLPDTVYLGLCIETHSTSASNNIQFRNLTGFQN